MIDITDTYESGTISTSVPNDLTLDHSSYHDDLAEANLSEEQKRELLEALWGIMRLFVEFGYSFDVSGRAVIEIFNYAARGDEEGKA